MGKKKIKGGGKLGALIGKAKGAFSKGKGKDAPGKGKGESGASPAASPPPPVAGNSPTDVIDDLTKKEGLQQLLNENAKESFTTKLLAFLKAVGRFFFSREYPIAHYITLALVIIFLIYGFSLASSRSRQKKRSKKRRWWERMLGPQISSYISPAPITENRPTIVGRCDNIDFIEKRVGNNGVCVSDKLPRPIQWIIDSDKIPELKELPQIIKDKLSKDGKRFSVTIPWKSDGMIYMPDCDKAVFADGTPAYLLVDGGGFCKKFELDKVMEMSKYRYIPEYSKYEGLDRYIGDADPNSSLVEKVSAGEVCSIQAAKDLGIFDNTRFYKPGYETIRTYNKNIDRNGAFTHKLCAESTVRDEASLLCPLVKNAGIGFTSKSGGKCITSECPTGFTEDKNDPTVCKKPIKEKIVPLNMRNDEQYDDWYTIPNYHLGNKYASSNTVHFAACPGNSIPYYAIDPVDNVTLDSDMKDQIDVCVDKSLYMGGKYSEVPNFCPVSLIKRVGSSRAELLNYYLQVSNNSEIPESEKQKIFRLVESIKGVNFSNLGPLSTETETACSRLNQDSDKLMEAYNICEQLARNEDSFMSKFTGEPSSLTKLRRDACKYSCQQLFGVPPEERNNPLATSENATRIEKPTLNFPDVEQIQFEEYIKEYEKETRDKEKELPVISAEPEKQNFVSLFTKGYIFMGSLGFIVILLIIGLYIKRKRVANYFCRFIKVPVLTIINLILLKIFNKVPITYNPCKTSEQLDQEEIDEKNRELERRRQRKELKESAEAEEGTGAAAPESAAVPAAAPGSAAVPAAAPGKKNKLRSLFSRKPKQTS